MGWCDFWADIPGPPAPACKGKDAVEDSIADAASSAWESIVRDFMSGAVWLVKQVGLGWLRVDTPALSTDSGTVHFLMSSTTVLTQGLAVLCLILAGARMAWTRRADGGREAAVAVLRLIAATTAAVAVVNLLAIAGDGFSVWLINRSLGCSGQSAGACSDAFAEKLRSMMDGLDDGDQLAISFIVALLMIISGIVQLVCIIARQAMLFVLAGTLPLAAAASSTEQGQAWWKKSLGWLLAFLAYKPAAAIIYAASFSLFSDTKDGDLVSHLYGVTLLIMAAVSLPALMRVIVPAVAEGSMGGGGGGGGTGRMAARVATGAMAIKSGGASLAIKAAASGGKSGGGATGSGTPGGGGSGPKRPPGPGTPPESPGGPGGAGGGQGGTGAAPATPGTSGSSGAAPAVPGSGTGAPASSPASKPGTTPSSPVGAPARTTAGTSGARGTGAAPKAPAPRAAGAGGAPSRPAAPPAPVRPAPTTPHRPGGPRGSN